MPIGDMIRMIRMRRGWSQTRMGVEFGCDASLICRFERERKTVPHDFLVAAARNFECPELLERTDLWRTWAQLTGYPSRDPAPANVIQFPGRRVA